MRARDTTEHSIAPHRPGGHNKGLGSPSCQYCPDWETLHSPWSPFFTSQFKSHLLWKLPWPVLLTLGASWTLPTLFPFNFDLILILIFLLICVLSLAYPYCSKLSLCLRPFPQLTGSSCWAGDRVFLIPLWLAFTLGLSFLKVLLLFFFWCWNYWMKKEQSCFKLIWQH